ncbi:polysaccharide biosynthesis C-terminal domain-containing protein, partial [Balneolaceae bacterium ANBcel3]|nr:polysaccharide biosynthesis C-terminal domain-containing protein [Balneolaceae bacterium ANBcel3]
LIDSRYWMGLYIVPWLLMAYWLQGWFLNFMAGVFIKEKMWYMSAITIAGALITLIGNSLLVPVYGMQGAVWVSLACFATMAGLMYLLVRRIYPVPYKIWKNIFILILSGSIVSVGRGFGTDFFEPFVAKMVLFVVSLALLILAGWMEQRQRS